MVAIGHRAWLIADPGAEVHDSRPRRAEPVVVGPPGATRREVDRARRDARRLLKDGGPLAFSAGIDVDNGFRTAVLEGGGESRRDAVLAAVELLGVDQLDRIGERGAVLVALFGPRATRRVGKAALDVLASGRCSPLRLAVAASDFLGPEQLEAVLAFTAPTGVEPVPREHNMLALAGQLEGVLAPVASRRRLRLIRSLWNDVMGWQASAAAMARARRRRVSPARVAAWQREVQQSDDAWWRAQALDRIGEQPTAAEMLSWVPHPSACWGAVARAFQEAVAATALLRTALAAEDQPVQVAVVAHLDQLAYAATCHAQGVPDRIASVRNFRGRGLPASDRAGRLASAAAVASDPEVLARFVNVDGERVDRRDVNQFLVERLRDACELAQAVLRSSYDVLVALQPASLELARTPALTEWRAIAGYTPVRDPRLWTYRWLGLGERESLAHRLARGDAEPADVELLDDGLWLVDLGDALAAWYGHERADAERVWYELLDFDPPAPPPDPRAPLLESVPLAVAGVAQLISIGAVHPARGSTWREFVDGLVRQSETLGLGDEFAVAEEVAAWDGGLLPSSELVLEVARTPQRLAEWGNFMGNCIADYASDAREGYALLAAKDAAGKLVANIAIVRGGLRWRVDQALARFNEPLPAPVRQAIQHWAESLPVPSGAVPTGPRRRPPGGGRRGRRPSARDRLVRATADLGGAVGELRDARAPQALLPIAAELGWRGDRPSDNEDWLSPFVAIARPRREGPLAAATARALAGGASLAELWQATAFRPLAAALATLDPGDVDLRRLTDATVPGSLRLALRDPRLWSARVLDLAAGRVRLALGDLLRAADPALDEAVVRAPHLGFVAAGVLVVTADQTDGRALEWVSVDGEGVVPGRPRSSVNDPGGPWAAARLGAVELGAAPARLDEVMADAPRRFLVIPQAWVGTRGWNALWARAHRIARETAQSAV